MRDQRSVGRAATAIFLESFRPRSQIAGPMRVVLTWLLLPALLFAPFTQAQAAAGKLDRIQMWGRDYVRLADWAAANNFAINSADRRKVVTLSTASQHFEFTVNSAEAEFNGVKLWLAYPVAQSGTGPCVSWFDLQNTVQPLAFPPKNVPGAKVKFIVLDPGHGGKDTGNRVGAQAEKKFTLLLAFEIRELLKRADIKVALTRSTDTFVELPDRPAKAQRLGADMFVSLHFNATDEARNEVKGSEVYCLTPAGVSSTNTRGQGANAPWTIGNRYNEKNLLLAYQIQRSLLHNLGLEDRGVRRARFAVLRDAAMPAVLIEAGFMSHPTEGRKIFDPAYRRQLAQAIVNGIVAYKRQVER